MTSGVMKIATSPGIVPLMPGSPFGSHLRAHRAARGLSQERLAGCAEISPRHLSCLETGRAAPSRAMVLMLGSALDLPMRERNVLLETAGFAAHYRDHALDSAEEANLARALDHLLRQQEPYGAVVIDRCWNLLRMNQGATRLFAAFADVAGMPPEVRGNVLVATLHPLGMRPAIVNFGEVAALVLERHHADAARAPESPEMRLLRATVAAIPDLPPRPSRAAARPAGPFLTLHLRRGGLEARLFTMLTTIGTPTDVTAEEVQIESYYPADAATERLCRELAGVGG